MTPPRSAAVRLTLLLSVVLTHATLLLAMARTMDPVVLIELAISLVLYSLIAMAFLVFGGGE